MAQLGYTQPSALPQFLQIVEQVLFELAYQVR